MCTRINYFDWLKGIDWWVIWNQSAKRYEHVNHVIVKRTRAMHSARKI